MGQSLEVVTSELHSAAARLADAGQRLQDGLSSVDLEVGQLLGSGWKGGAATAYKTEWDKWHGGAGQVIRGLQMMSELLTSAASEYDRTDQQGGETVNSSFQPGGGSGSGAAGSNSRTTGQAGVDAASGSGAPDMAESTSLMQPAAEAGGQVAQALAQATGQMAGGMAQAAAAVAQAATGIAQGVVGLAQQAGQVQSPGEGTPDEKAADDKRDKRDDSLDESGEGDHEVEKSGGATSSGGGSAAPIEAAPVEPPTSRENPSGGDGATTRAVGRSDD